MDQIVNTLPAWAAYGSLLVMLLGAAWLKRQMPLGQRKLHEVEAPAPRAKPAIAVPANEAATRRALLEKTLSEMTRETQEAPTLPMARVDTRVETVWADTAPFVDSRPAFAATEPAPLEATAQFSR